MPVYKSRETINSREELLEEFDEDIFNALVEKIEILTPAHFVFKLKSGLRVEEVVFCESVGGVRKRD